MERSIVVQKIRKKYPSPIEVGMRYYSVLSALNNLGFTTRQLQILAFTAMRGTISAGGARESFHQLFGSTKASLDNMISYMLSKGFLVKEGNRTTVNPALAVNFDGPIILQISLSSD